MKVVTKDGTSVVGDKGCKVLHQISDELPSLNVGFDCKVDHVLVNGKKLTENAQRTTDVPCDVLVDGTQAIEKLEAAPFSIVLPYKEPVTIQTTADVRKCVAKMLTNVEKGPVKLAKEEPAKRERAIMIRHNNFDRYSPEVVVVGSGSLASVGVIVIDRAKEKKLDCHYAKGHVAVRREITSLVTIYDRTTGAEIAKKTFAPPKGSCDETLLVNTKTGRGKTEGTGDTATRVSFDEVTAWAKSQLAK
jgi:hypothetical protein